MRICYWPYELVGLKSIRRGVLLRWGFQNGTIGYSDCHPWPELGDYPLKDQLHLLRKSRFTNLTYRSLHFAKLDAEARQKQISLFSGLIVPPSHLLIPDLTRANDQTFRQGFTHYKIKLGKNLKTELEFLQMLLRGLSKQVKLRLDFNGTLTPDSFQSVVKALNHHADRIEFFEDPFHPTSHSWRDPQNKRLFQFARDAHSDKELRLSSTANFLVVKPATESLDKYKRIRYPHHFVVTSYLDHPLGQLTAAYEAAKLRVIPHVKMSHCGLLSHLVYQPNIFSDQLNIQEATLIPPNGTGFGFDELLSNLSWSRLT